MNEKPLFSILIPSWNNLDFLKLCVVSIRKNSAYSHEILVHVNDGSDGTLDWVKAEGLKFTHSPENIGVCYALNGLRRNRTELVIGRCADLAGWARLTDGEELFPQLCCACVLRYPHVPFTGFYRYEMTVSGAVQLIRTRYDGRIMHVRVLSGMLPMDEDDWSRAPVRDYTVEDGVLAEA